MIENTSKKGEKHNEMIKRRNFTNFRILKQLIVMKESTPGRQDDICLIDLIMTLLNSDFMQKAAHIIISLIAQNK